MSKERLKSPRARLFIALDLPAAVRSGIDAWGREALADPALRRVEPEALHITLAFLGWRAERDVDRLATILRESTTGAPSIELHDPVSRPPRGRPRLYALEARSPQVLSLQAAIEERLVSGGLFTPEKRPFWPHVTVARVRPEARGSKHPMRVSKPPGKLPQSLVQPALCVRTTLYRSKLQPQGAQYTPLAQVELSEDGRQ